MTISQLFLFVGGVVRVLSQDRHRRSSFCSATSNPDTLIAGGGAVVAGGGEKLHEEDLKSWMHKHVPVFHCRSKYRST